MQSYQDRPTSSDFELRDLLAIVRRHLVPIAVILAVVLGAMAVLSYRKTPVYEASVSILVDFDALTSASSPGSASEAARTLQNEIELLQGEDVVTAAAEAAGEPIAVSATTGDGSDVIVLSARSTDPEEAAETVNTYAAAYIDVRQGRVLEELQRRQGELEEQIAEIQTEIDETTATIDGLYAQRGGLPADDPQFAQLSQQITTAENARNTATVAQDQLQAEASEIELAIDQARQRGGLELLDEAGVPTSPVSPDHRKDLLVALAAALVVAAAYVFVREQLDDTVRTKEELERLSALPVVGVIPRIDGWRNADQSHLETRVAPRSSASEAYRTLLTSLEFIQLDRKIRVLQVTSASPGEGKTTTAANLAVAYADAGRRTLIVCCDLRRPRLHRFFDCPPDPGFTSVLLGQSDLEEAVLPAPGTPGLHVLPAGPMPANPAELLRGSRASDLVRQLRNDHDVVILDSPPVLPVADALLLSRQSDATLVVATAQQTTRRHLRRALEGLRQVDASLVGTVLNAVPPSEDYGYDVSYYGYDDRRNAPPPADANGQDASTADGDDAAEDGLDDEARSPAAADAPGE